MKNYALVLLLTLSMFAFLNTKMNAQSSVVITEIMYNPPETGADSLEFLEIYNNENTAINLSEISFTAGIEHHFSNQILDPLTHLILVKDSVAFQNAFGIAATQWTSGSLSNSGETIEIRNSAGDLIDEVSYLNTAPWSAAADGLGASLVLCDADSDNTLAENWAAASTPTGIFIDNLEVIANPSAASNCPTGPIISFLENSVNVIEDDVTIALQIAIENGNANTTEVTFDLLPNSTAVIDTDFSLQDPLPWTVTFPANLEKDTQTIFVNILEDTDIEMNETLFFELTNATNGAIVNPMQSIYQLFIEDDDATLPKLVISEIMYNPPEVGMDSTEFIEIYNNDTLAVNLVNYSFSAGINFTFPDTIIAPTAYLIIASDSIAFKNYYDFSPLQWTSGSLTNSGELIELRNFGGNVAAAVDYDNTADWSLIADGQGASLVICDVNSAMNDPANWEASISPTGIVIEGFEIFANPNTENQCFVPLAPYPLRSVGEMTNSNNDGILDSLNQTCALRGIVHGVNFNASNGGLQFVLIDDLGDGITVYENTQNFGYAVQEGDEVMVQGSIAQFNGLAEIIPDTLWTMSDNNSLTIPQEVTALDESTESQLVRLNNLTILDPTDWDNTSPNGFNVAVSNGQDTFTLRIDNDVDLFDLPMPNFSFNLTGLGSQFDADVPFTEDYQILPRYLTDLEMITSTSTVSPENEIQIYPNPTCDFFFLEIKRPAKGIRVYNVFGKIIYEKINIGTTEKIDCTRWLAGTYFISIFDETSTKNVRVIKSTCSRR